MTTTIRLEDQTYTEAGLGGLSGAELADLYRRVSGRPTQRFATKGRAVARTWAALQQAGEPVPAGGLVQRLVAAMSPGHRCSVSELALELGATERQVRGAIDAARRTREIQNVGRGVFQLVRLRP